MVYDKVTLSVPNIALASALRVFPNPVKAGETDVYLQIEEPAEISVQVYDLNGKLLVSKDYGKCESGVIAIPISSLQPGNYLLNINKDGKSDVAKLIIK